MVRGLLGAGVARDFEAEERGAEVVARGLEAGFEASGRRVVVFFAAVLFLAVAPLLAVEVFFAPAGERRGVLLAGLFLGVLTA